MGDQRLEWEIQEEEENEFSKSEESKMSMILNKGWRLGKKIVITGMAISSAPIVLPPLVIFSSIGFAVAVPFGFVFISYACTEKLMSKLLSRPLNPPSLLELKIYDDDYVEGVDFQEDGFTGEFMDDEVEEKKFREDTKESLEMRIELVGDEKEDEGFVVNLSEQKPVEDVNGVMEEESRESLYFDNYVEEEEKPGEDMNGVVEQERGDGTYFDNYVEEEEKSGEDMNVVMEKERAEGMYFDDDVEEEKSGEDMNGVMEEEMADGTYFDNDVEAKEKSLKEFVGDAEEEYLRRGTGGIMEDYTEDVEAVDENIEEEEKPVEVFSGEIEEEELVMREREEFRDEENADNVIEFEEGVKESAGDFEQEEEEEMRPVRETEGVMEESRPEENVGMMVVLGTEGEKGEESDELVQEGKKHLEETVENMEEEQRLIREAKGGFEESRDEEPLDKLIATDNGVAQNAEEISGEQNASGMAQENYIVGKELPSPRVEIIGVIEEENVNDVTQDDAIVEEAVPVVVDVTQEGYIVEEAVPVLDTAQEEVVPVVEVTREDNIEEPPIVDATQVGYIEETIPVAKISGKEENVNDVAEEGYIVRVVPVVEINGVTPVAEMNGVTKEENRDDESIGKFANDIEEVRPMKGIKEVEESKEGVDLKKNIEKEEVPVEEIHGIVKGREEGVNNVLQGDKPIEEPIRMKEERKVEEIFDRIPEVEVKPVEEMGAMVEETRDEEKADKIGSTDSNAVVAERRDKGITDRMVEVEKEPIVETEKRLAPSQTENARESADESGLDFFDDEIVDADQSYSYGSVKPLDHEIDSEPCNVSLEQVSAVKEPTTENARESADESGLHLFDDEIVDDEIADADQPYSYGSVESLDHEVDSEPRYVSLEQVSEVKEPTTQNLAKEMADPAGHPLSAEMAESQFNKEAHEQEGIIPSKEVLYSEEKMWEQIDAMRKIVGYKAALQATCMEELKALYVFIGVEPPLAFKVPSDLAEINDKLRLLMSIIGVK